MARLKSIIKNINRRTKWVKMTKIGFNGSAGEARERQMVIGIRKFAATMFGTRSEASRESIAEVGVVFQSRRPEGGINSSRPTVCSMEQRSTGALSEVTNTVLGFAILMMGIHTAKRKSLMGTMDRLAEGLGIKETIVGLVMTNANTMGSSDMLKGLLGSNGGFSIVSRHEVDIGKIRVVINKDGGSSVTLDSGATAATTVRDKSRSRANKLVNTNNIPRSSCFADGLAIVNAFGTQRFLVSFAVGTTRTSLGGQRWQDCKE